MPEDLSALWEGVKAAGSVGLKHRSSRDRLAVLTDKDCHSMTARAIVGGSRPARSQPAAAAATGIPTTIRTR
ncbi:MAG: hypothetical protein K0S82_1360 [Gaiellaceae bacterium]|nr:hypothetical protein [Gaiellaceae bacterium]